MGSVAVWTGTKENLAQYRKGRSPTEAAAALADTMACDRSSPSRERISRAENLFHATTIVEYFDNDTASKSRLTLVDGGAAAVDLIETSDNDATAELVDSVISDTLPRAPPGELTPPESEADVVDEASEITLQMPSIYTDLDESLSGLTAAFPVTPALPKTYHIRMEWLDEHYNLRPAGSNDIELPSSITTFSELEDLVCKDAGSFAPFTELDFFAYNKYGNLVALGSRFRLQCWIKGLAVCRPQEQSPPVLWITQACEPQDGMDPPTLYMATIERLTIQRMK